MTDLVIRGMTTEQVRLFIEWYGEAGEQDAYEYFDAHGLEAPTVDYTEHRDCKTGYWVADLESKILMLVK